MSIDSFSQDRPAAKPAAQEEPESAQPARSEKREVTPEAPPVAEKTAAPTRAEPAPVRPKPAVDDAAKAPAAADKPLGRLLPWEPQQTPPPEASVAADEDPLQK